MNAANETVKMSDELKECVRLWNLNKCTGPSQEKWRVISRGGNALTFDDEDWDSKIANGGSSPCIIGLATQRSYLQFMPSGTDIFYDRDEKLIREPLPEFLSNAPESAHWVMKTRIAEFRRTAEGREIYDNAPEGAKRFYARDANTRNHYDIYREMDDASWDYVIAHARTEHLKEDLADIREHMQGQSEGTNMFWWRGRFRPKNKDSFDMAKMKEIVSEYSLATIGHFSEYYAKKNGDLSLEELRKLGLAVLFRQLNYSCNYYHNRGFFFRGPFWDLHYWDDSSRDRFMGAMREMISTDRLGRLKAVMSAMLGHTADSRTKKGEEEVR